MIKMTNKNKIPVLTEAVCMADSPPPTKRAIATAPSIKAHKMRCPTGASSFPPAVMLSITNEPLSDEVTKKTATIKIPKKLVRALKGNSFKKTNKEVELSSRMMSDNNPGVSISSPKADPPKTDIQKKVIRVGTKSTPRTNSRTVRPFETRAMNMPTKGDQAIHQAQ